MATKLSKIQKMNHAAGIFADISVDGPAIGTLVAVVDRAKNLPNRKTMGKQNPYCAARLGKEAKKTETDFRGGQTPKWDQELRFTVHESADYFKLKVSVFNDDKKTDLIGETWIDLKGLIIPGGSQDDHWHPLQYRGKYAGEVRIEMTYYDTRPEDEAVIERRKGAPEKTLKTLEKIASPSTGSSSSSLSGPRQLNDVKRRPLPVGPNVSQHVRSRRSVQEAPVLQPYTRQPEQAYPATAAAGSVYTQYPDQSYDMTRPSPAVYPAGTYGPLGDLQRKDQVLQAPLAGYLSQQGYSHKERPDHFDMYPHSSYQTFDMPTDYHNGIEYPRPAAIEEADGYALAAKGGVLHRAHEQSAVVAESWKIPYEQVTSFQNMYEATNPNRPTVSGFNHPHSQRENRNRNPYSGVRRENFSEYAAMQPRVEDEKDECLPPPPPAHRSGFAHTDQISPVHQFNTPGQRPKSSHSSDSPSGRQLNKRIADPSTTKNEIPASLVAGFDPSVAEDEADRMKYEMQITRKDSRLAEENPALYAEPLSYAPPYPVGQHESTDEQRKSLDDRRSASSDSRAIRRKSVSPQPGRIIEREPSIPFSPDSYDVLNPNAARSAVIRHPRPIYDTPAEAADAVWRSEVDMRRDPGPIVGDDGQEIDPSDHLPANTWAPEPEKKNRKPEVRIRFPNREADSNARDIRANYNAQSTEPSPDWDQQTHGPDAADRTPNRGREGYGKNYSVSKSDPSYRTAMVPSSLYAPRTGPPIPAKVPIAQASGSGHAAAVAGQRMDALSRELKSIDIGSVGCGLGRERRYAARSTTRYAV